MLTQKNFNIPNSLTILRIILMPFLVLMFFLDIKGHDLVAFIIFVIGCVTDYLDGIVARKKQQITRLGQFLDPLADKLVITITTVLIIGFNVISKHNIVAVIIIIARELSVSDLRNTAKNQSIDIKSSQVSKTKTFMQMMAFGFILLYYVCHNKYILIVGELLLWMSAILSIVSCVQYFYSYKYLLFDKES